MLRSTLLKNLCITILTVFFLNTLATFFSWYSLLWWFDMLMHFLGGIAVFYLGAILWLPARSRVSTGRFLYEGIITALLLGVLWEALELFLHVRYGTPDFVLLDSISDLCFDLAGTLLAAFWTYKLVEIPVDSGKK